VEVITNLISTQLVKRIYVKVVDYMQNKYVINYNSNDYINKVTEPSIDVQKYIQQIEQINKQLNEFVYIVSHDLKAPLRGIKSLTTFLEEELGKAASPEVKELLTLLQSRTDRLQAMTEAILHYSRLANNSGESELINLNKLVTAVIDMLPISDGIRIEQPNNLPVISGEKIKIHEVFQNLLSNAIKYSDKPEVIIKIQSIEKPTEYEFAISDNGPGIKPEFFEKIFRVFQTLQSKDKQESTGIGLTIVKKIVEQHGGKIWVESEVGNGSIFKFTWKK
jgi:light-regulated signal transduction histidine kinase (bacteriophytochrome)